MYKNVIPISVESFRPFGRVIGYPNLREKGTKRNLWRIVLDQPQAKGWRIAYLVVRDRKLNRLECHPSTFESFEPVNGRAILFVSRSQDLDNLRAFYLTSPVVLRKGIWHGIITASEQTEVKITENSKVAIKYWRLPQPISSKIRLVK